VEQKEGVSTLGDGGDGYYSHPENRSSPTFIVDWTIVSDPNVSSTMTHDVTEYFGYQLSLTPRERVL